MSRLAQCDECIKGEESPRECEHFQPLNDNDCPHYQPCGLNTGHLNPALADRKIRGWLLWFLIIVLPVGAILTAYFSFSTSLEDMYNPETGHDVAFWLYVVDRVFAIGLLSLAIYTIISFYQFKPNAVGLGKTYVIIVFIANLLTLSFGEYETSGIGSLSQLIRAIVWGGVWFTFLCVSEQVNRLFPKKERHFYKRDKWALCIFVCAILFGITAIFVSAFAYGMKQV